MELDQLIAESVCFGKAYDETVKECKRCEVSEECKIKKESTGETKPKSAGNKTTVKPKEKSSLSSKSSKGNKGKKATEDFGINFKAMSINELEAMGKKHKVNVSDLKKKYANPGIYRMRLTMAIKSALSK